MMKIFYKVFIVLLLSTSSFFSVAQSGYIDSLFILPQTPTATTPISVVCHSYFTSGHYTLYDVLGNMIQYSLMREIITQINVSHLAKGIYYIEVVTPTSKGVKKFIKQ